MRLVLDLNVVFDLDAGGVLSAAVEVPEELHLVDVAAAHLSAAALDRLVSLGVLVTSVSGGGVLRAAELADRFRKPRSDDLFSLALAEEIEAILVTGDKALRSAAAVVGVVTHGTIWFLAELIRAGDLDPRAAADALEAMLVAGRRLPASEAAKHVEVWRAL